MECIVLDRTGCDYELLWQEDMVSLTLFGFVVVSIPYVNVITPSQPSTRAQPACNPTPPPGDLPSTLHPGDRAETVLLAGLAPSSPGRPSSAAESNKRKARYCRNPRWPYHPARASPRRARRRSP